RVSRLARLGSQRRHCASSSFLSCCSATPGGSSRVNQLIDPLWDSDYVGDTKTLDVHVKRLRSRVGEHPSRPRHLVTVRGLGYKFEP
ncbi:MAG: two-component system, OmpR family, response regulator RegX3, partial [Actinomycetota bacterium]|nr:two-component system, OmpR family, response regulator RegX3 [Actinomycetota bacterium]